MPKIEKALNFAADDVPAQFPKINQGLNIASQGIDQANGQLNDAKGFVTQLEVESVIIKMQFDARKI